MEESVDWHNPKMYKLCFLFHQPTKSTKLRMKKLSRPFLQQIKTYRSWVKGTSWTLRIGQQHEAQQREPWLPIEIESKLLLRDCRLQFSKATSYSSMLDPKHYLCNRSTYCRCRCRCKLLVRSFFVINIL